jgi:hypothetical protein
MNLAAKTEEYHSISLNDLINSLPDAESLRVSIPRLEVKLLSALDFNLFVEQPWGTVLYLCERIREDVGDESTHLRVYDSACEIIRQWQMTEIVILWEPAEFGILAVFKIFPKIFKNSNLMEKLKKIEKKFKIFKQSPGIDEISRNTKYK